MDRIQAALDHDPFHTVLERATLHGRDLECLAAGRCSALQVSHFLTPRQCERFMRVFKPDLMNRYDPYRYAFPTARLGPVLNEFTQAESISAEYWTHADQTSDYWQHLEADANIRTFSMKYLTTIWPGPLRALQIDGHPLFWGIIREINQGTLIHWDEMVRECHAIDLSELPVVQLACNIFISVPEQGGDTRIWRHQWQPADERFRHRFGYHDTVMDAHAPLSVRPRLGDAIFFDSRTYHRVAPAIGGRRVTLSFFLGITAHGTLLLWS